MKNFFRFIHKPKHVALVSVTIAVIIAIVSYALINRAPGYQFATITSGTIAIAGTSATSTNISAQNLTLGFLAGGEVESVSVKVGDSVKTGEILAALLPQNTLGDLTQAKAAYAAALANYEKVEDGATAADIAVSSTSLITAQVELAHSQQTLVQTINDSFTTAQTAISNDTDMLFTNPETNTPELSIAGDISFTNQALVYQIQNERAMLNQLMSSWKGNILAINVNNAASSSIEAQNNLQSVATYLGDLNTLLTTYTSGGSATEISADQSAVAGARASITAQISSLIAAVQTVSTAEANVNQSQAALALTTSAAQPEDIAAAQAEVANAEGAVQIAEAAYDNYLIIAPSDGVVSAVYITAGQIAAPNAPAIDLSGATNSFNVAMMIPNSAIIERNGAEYALVKAGNGTQEKQITIGISDTTDTQVLSGLSVGDQVVTH